MRVLASRFFLVCLVSCFFFTFVSSANAGQGEKRLAAEPLQVTVAEAKGLPDDTLVIVHGRLDEQLDKKRYTLRDDTGSIVVKIKRKHWAVGHRYAKGMNVVLHGEVEVDDGKVSIDAISVEGKS